ncbi:MAG TPA: thioredoxin family protein, partial [Candidatus Kapabacteria bacterium]|nr:thioredoxin family protein [Candidatus Kapabacteria bacterium]
WLDNYEEALNLARQQKKNVFIDFTGYTCTNCRWMEANVFSKPEVDSLLQQFVLVKLYTDGEGAVYEQNQKFEETRFGTIALPMYAVMSAQDETVVVFSKGMTRDVPEFTAFLKSGLPPNMLAEK